MDRANQDQDRAASTWEWLETIMESRVFIHLYLMTAISFFVWLFVAEAQPKMVYLVTFWWNHISLYSFRLNIAFLAIISWGCFTFLKTSDIAADITALDAEILELSTQIQNLQMTIHRYRTGSKGVMVPCNLNDLVNLNLLDSSKFQFQPGHLSVRPINN